MKFFYMLLVSMFLVFGCSATKVAPAVKTPVTSVKTPADACNDLAKAYGNIMVRCQMAPFSVGYGYVVESLAGGSCDNVAYADVATIYHECIDWADHADCNMIVTGELIPEPCIRPFKLKPSVMKLKVPHVLILRTLEGV